MPEKRQTFPTFLRIAALLAELITHIQDILVIAKGLAALAGVAAFYGLITKNGPLLDFSIKALSIIGSGLVVAYVINFWHRRKDKAISESFCNLQRQYIAFESEVMKIGFMLALDKGDRPISFVTLSHYHQSYLRELCETAATVFSARKPLKGKIHANIKMIRLGKNSKRKEDCVYDVVARSRKTPRQREEIDRQRKLKDDYMYNRIFDDGVKKDYFLETNLGLLLASERFRECHAEEPNEDTLQYYSSCLVNPIMGTPNSVTGSSSALFKYTHDRMVYDVHGLMCVGSKRTRAFNENYDLDIMDQLSSYAFSTFRMVQGLEDLAKMKGVAIVRY
jgi:hypothetical protein